MWNKTLCAASHTSVFFGVYITFDLATKRYLPFSHDNWYRVTSWVKCVGIRGTAPWEKSLLMLGSDFHLLRDTTVLLKPNRMIPLKADVKASVLLYSSSSSSFPSFLPWLTQKTVISEQMEILLFNKSNLCRTPMAFASQGSVIWLCVFKCCCW